MPISPFGYPLDLTGTALSNKIVGDVTTFTSPESRSFVPAAGPFYVFNMILRNNVTGQLLAPKTDYMVEYLLPEPSMASGKEVAGLIRVINIDINSVSMDYHVIGGVHGNSVTMLQQYLADNPITPINPVWGEIPDMQVQYPPAAHLTDMATVFGLGPLVNVIEGVRKAILSGDTAAWGAVYRYLNLRLSQEHAAILQDVANLTRLVPDSPTPYQVLMSLAGNAYGWGDYIPTPPAAGKVLVGTGTGRGEWTWGDFPPNNTTVAGASSSCFLHHVQFPTTVTPAELRLKIREPGINIDGVFRGAGTTASLQTTGVTADTLFMVYAYWDGAAVQLEYVATGYQYHDSQPVAHKAGDTSRTFVGLFYKAPNGLYMTRSYFSDQRQYKSFHKYPTYMEIGAALYRAMTYQGDVALSQNTDIYTVSMDNSTLYLLQFDHEITDVGVIVNFTQSLPGPSGTVTGDAHFYLIERVTGNPVATYNSHRVGGGGSGALSVYGRVKDVRTFTSGDGPIVWKLGLHVGTFSYPTTFKQFGVFDSTMTCTDLDVYPYQIGDTYQSNAENQISEMSSGLYIRESRQTLLPYL